MELLTRGILIWLLICSFIGTSRAWKQLSLPSKIKFQWPNGIGSCETDNDCLKGKAYCLRRECHCKGLYGYGDGKTQCAGWGYCRYLPKDQPYDPCKVAAKRHRSFWWSYCLQNYDNREQVSCRCRYGYFGIARWNSKGCKYRKKTRYDEYPCLTDRNCPIYSKCNSRQGCECRDELIGDGETCKSPMPPKCSSQSTCTSWKGACQEGTCRCFGLFAGNGIFCRQGKACAKNNCGPNTECLIDPLFPKSYICRCLLWHRRNKDVKCVECLDNSHCKKIYSICVDEKCTCKEGLILGETSCEHGPAHPCNTDGDCNWRAKCVEGKCICQGKTSIGNGKYCRDSDPCPQGVVCGHGTCLKDPLMPKHPAWCRCDEGYVNNKNGMCVECISDSDCDTTYSTCANEFCKCKDELIKEGKTCKRAPLHPCKGDADCDRRADCIQGKCYCGKTADISHNQDGKRSRVKYTGNGKFCRETLACPGQYSCDEQEACIVDPLFPNDPECKCRDGTAKTTDDGKCEVVNECFKRGFVCPALSSCKLVKDTYSCVCNYGYEMKSVTIGKQTLNKCLDIDECMTTKPCPDIAVCINSEGSYTCKCNAGYRNNADNQDICEDINECYEVPNACGVNQRCVNVPGSYNCQCDTGYVQSAGGCIKPGRDVSTQVCHCKDNWECDDSGKCRCKEGYSPCTLCNSHWIATSLTTCQRTSECPQSWSEWAPKHNIGCCLLCCCRS